MNNQEATMNLTNDEVLELAKEAGFNPSLLSDRFIKLNELITEKLQEKSQGEAIYQLHENGAWRDVEKPYFDKMNMLVKYRIVYLHPASEQPQSVKDVIKKIDGIIQERKEDYLMAQKNCVDESGRDRNGARAYAVHQLQEAIRALIEQPAQPPVVLNNMSNSPEHVANYIKQSMPNNSKEIIALMTSPNLDECVNRFLGWKLPSDFSPDCGISFEQYSNPDNDRYKALREPTGTNLFNAEQAKAMFQHVLKGATTELAEQPPASQELLDYDELVKSLEDLIFENINNREVLDVTQEYLAKNLLAKVKEMQTKDVKQTQAISEI